MDNHHEVTTLLTDEELAPPKGDDIRKHSKLVAILAAVCFVAYAAGNAAGARSATTAALSKSGHHQRMCQDNPNFTVPERMRNFWAGEPSSFTCADYVALDTLRRCDDMVYVWKDNKPTPDNPENAYQVLTSDECPVTCDTCPVFPF